MVWRYDLWSTLFVFIVSILAIIFAFMSIWLISIMFLPITLYSGWYLIKMIKRKTTFIEEPCGKLYETLKEKRKKKLEKLNTL